MKIIFNDATWLQIQSASAENGALRIKTISAKQETLSALFADTNKTKRMIVKENEKVLAEYINYTNFRGIMAYAGGILEPIMYRVGDSPEEQIQKLKEENELLNEQMYMLTECVLELSEEVYR